MLDRYYDPNPDLGEHAWQEEDGFFHGYLNGCFFRMVCSRAELEEIRQKELEVEEGTLLDTESIWWLLDGDIDPYRSDFGQFEPDFSFANDLDSDIRRQLLAVNFYLDPKVTTWYGLSVQYDLMMGFRRKKDRQAALMQRLQAFGLDPKRESDLAVRRQRMLALEFGLHPFTASEEDIARCNLELHKVVFSQALVQRASDYLQDQPLTFADLLRTALETYLANQPGTEHS